MAALGALHHAETNAKHVTGLLYFDGTRPALHEDLKLVERPLVELQEKDLRPSKEALDKINIQFRG